MQDTSTDTAPTQTDTSNNDQDAPARGSLPWLVQIMQRLLAPDGCPWDREQSLQSLRPYLIEECYEVLEAIDSGNRDHHCEELGDVLLQIVFQTELARITMAEVIQAIGDKLIRRHPHVFGDVRVRDADEVVSNWEAIKAKEKGKPQERDSALDGIPTALPALHRSHELTRKAARAGFRWQDNQQARTKLQEELAEADEAVSTGNDEAIRHEVGDLLLAVAGWARQLGVEPEQALRDANRRFDKRFRQIEAQSDRPLSERSFEDLLRMWNETSG